MNEGLKWVRDQKFEISNEQINAALLYADGWTASKDMFKAAIIAAVMNYDLVLIEQVTSQRYTVEIYDAAKRIVEAHETTDEPVVVE